MEDKIVTENKKPNYIFILLLSALLFLRFPFLILLSYHKIPISNALGINIFDDGTYLITAILIILNRKVLSDYNIDLCSLFIFIIAPIAEIPGNYLLMNATQTSSFLTVDPFKIVVSICLLVFILFCRPKLRKRSTKEVLLWLSIAIAVGIGSGILMGNISSLQSDGKMTNHAISYYLIGAFFVQLSNAAVIEEPLFRGFLWGFLKNIHWKDYWIWLFQASLFMLGHIYYIGVYNYSFWIIVPVSALILGLLVWRSRSIGTSMIAHGLINSVADVVAHFKW